MLNRAQQQGFVLVSVLLITSVSTFVAFSSIGENRLQERIAGNQVKEINARSQAEKGLFQSSLYIQTRKVAGDSLISIASTINSISVADKYDLSAEVSGSGNALLILSQGKYQGAVAYLKAEITVDSSPASGGPGGAVVACEGVSITGGGRIDSFDSREGAYSLINSKSNADVVTISGNVYIKGGTNLKGDITANGNVTQSGSTTIGGDIAASGNVTLAQAKVEGSISSSQNISLTGGMVGDISNENSGNVSALGTLALKNGSEKSVNATTNGKGAVNANGGLIKPDWLDESNFSEDIQTTGATAPSMASNKCNEKDIATALPTVMGSDINSNMATAHKGALRQLEFNEVNARLFDEGGTKDPLVDIYPTDLTSSLWEGNKPVYVFDEFNIKNTMITIVGDVTIMIKGDLITSGGGTGFQFNENDTNSSLTILSEGQVDIASSSSIFNNATIDKVNQKIPLTIYSSFDSSGSNVDKNAVFLDGAANMYAKVYAPLGNVEYAASGAMMGMLEGKNVNVSGAGQIHYDEALKFVAEPDGSGNEDVKFASIYYHYPN
ncbi:MAG: hypothetical protein GY787_12775 [Alteromonadales bacterium]|nr:hypothetical protein [Alteromonadales bacterium]